MDDQITVYLRRPEHRRHIGSYDDRPGWSLDVAVRCMHGMLRGLVPDVRWVCQEDSHGCLVACLAMVTGQTYQQVRAGIPRFRNGGLGYPDGDSYLADRGYAVARRYRHVGYMECDRLFWPPEPFGLVHLCDLVPTETRSMGHTVVMLADGTVLDPLHDPEEGQRDLSMYFKVNAVAAVSFVNPFADRSTRSYE